MEILLIMAIVAAIFAFEFASVRWGARSTERFDSPEWDRRRAWKGFSNHS